MAESSSPGAAGPRDPNCPFCAIVAGDAPAERILETEHLVAFLDVRPLFRGTRCWCPRRT